MIADAKEIHKDTYTTKIKDIEYTIKLQKTLIKSISYKDEFENSVIINFKNQIQNSDINTTIFNPIIPLEYDIIRD
jgi:outer membrane lipoprotein carrier protein